MAKRILIVEVNPQTIEIYQLFLKSKGYTSTFSTKGEDCLKEFSQNPPDLLIMDVGLPDMDGVTLIKRIKEMQPDWSGSILAITAFAQAGDKEKIMQAGASAYLSKPVQMDSFLREIKRLLPKRQRKMKNT